MTDILLTLILVGLVGLGIQAHRHHKEMVQWLDSYAEMVGEAIDSWRGQQ